MCTCPINQTYAIFLIVLMSFLFIAPIVIFGFGLGIMIYSSINYGIITVLISIIWLVIMALVKYYYS